MRNEHEHRSTQQDSQRLRQTIDVLLQEQRDLNATLEDLIDEIKEDNAVREKRAIEKAEREEKLAEIQAGFLERKKSLESVEAAVTQSRIRAAALGEKRENTHVNLDNRLKLQEEAGDQIGMPPRSNCRYRAAKRRNRKCAYANGRNSGLQPRDGTAARGKAAERAQRYRKFRNS